MIYTRDFRQKNRVSDYTPPPGYDGNAFNEQREMFSAAAKAEYTERQPGRRSMPSDFGDSPETDSSEFSEEYYGGAEQMNRADSYDNPAGNGEESADERQTEVPVHSRAVKKSEHNHGIEALSALIESLHGRFGSEEMIILLVMLLVASDGIGPEVLILALILIAG